jgi:hypothetical protein
MSKGQTSGKPSVRVELGREGPRLEDLLKDPHAGAAAFARLAHERAALDAGTVRPLALNPLRVVQLVLARAPDIAGLEPAMAAAFTPEARKAMIKADLPTFALAVLHAYQQLRSLSTTPDAFDQLVHDCEAERDELLHWAPVGVSWRLYPQSKVDSVLPGTGYLDLADDLGVLGNLLLSVWEQLAPHVDLKKSAVEKALVLAQQLLGQLGTRGQNAALEKAVQDYRASLQLLVNAYDEARRQVSFLRWHEGDADQYAPSLFQTRGAGHPRSHNAGGAAPPVDPVAAPPAGATGSGGATSGG